MKKYIKDQLNDKSSTLPILTFPYIQKMGISVTKFASNSDYQSEALKMIAKNLPVSAVATPMDLSVEAEAFGAKIRFADGEIPTVVGRVIEEIEDVDKLAIPMVGAKRTSVSIETIKKAKMGVDKPVFAGTIGPFSLAGRLFDMTEIMINCYDEPEGVHKTLEKCSEFIKNYILALKAAGADGVIMAEPAAGLLSPSICEEFSSKYVKKIVEEVSDESFIFVYHNCGNVVPLYESIISIDADVYHFGNAIDIEDMLKLMPKNKLVMGNIDPILIKDGTSQTVKQAATDLLTRCSTYENFIISTGCDLPPSTPWENIESYFGAIKDFYKK